MKDSKIYAWETFRNSEQGDHLGCFSASPFLAPVFNFCFYLALVPFKTELDPKENKYILKTSFLQQIVCGVAHMGTLVYVNLVALADIQSINSADASSIIGIFHSGSNVCSALAVMMLVHMVWRKRCSYLQVVEGTRCTFSNKRELGIAHKLVYVGLTAMLIFFGIMQWFMSKILDDNREYYGSPNSSRENESMSTGDFLNMSSYLGESSGESSKAFLLKVLRFLLFFYLSMSYLLCQAVVSAVVLSLRKLGVEFCRDVREHCFGEGGIQMGFRKYRKVKSATDLIRNVFGNALLAYYLSSVGYYAEIPIAFLGRYGHVETIFMTFFIMSGVIWLIAAEFHGSVRTTVLSWIEFHSGKENISSDIRFKLHSLSREISADDGNSVALSNKCFAVTYKHVGSMFGLVITYGTIVSQLYKGQNTQ